MPVDDKKFNAKASNGDLAGVAIKLSMALDAVVDALEALEQKRDPVSSIEKLKEISEELDNTFDTLTGYVARDRG